MASNTQLPTAEPSSPFGEQGPGPAATAQTFPTEISAGRDVWRRFRKNRLAMAGMVIIALEVLAALLAPLITFSDPNKINAALSKAPPSLQHWFGTDVLGRDLYTRVVYGARVSLKVGLLAVLIALVLGLFFGAVSGYYGRIVDGLVMRVTDIFLAFPYILAAIVIISVLGRGVNTVIL